MNGDFVREWDSINEAENYYNNSGIASCLRNNCWTSNGYLWFYKGDENIVDIKEYVIYDLETDTEYRLKDIPKETVSHTETMVLLFKKRTKR